MTDAAAPKPLPKPLQITVSDVQDALRLGLADFRASPSFGLFFAAIFTVIGLVIFLQLTVWDASIWVIPFAVGFPLVGPFLAMGLYEVSRRRETGLDLDWRAVLKVVIDERGRQTPFLVALTIFFYLFWVYIAHMIFALTFGLATITTIINSAGMLVTPEGLLMLAIGTVAGGALALVLFMVTVVSVPMILDRDIDVISAMIVSVQTFNANRGPLLVWGGIVGTLILVAMIPAFLGMLLVFPVLGHATWHLYRRAVEADPSP